MATIKTYPLKTNYYGPDRLIISDMQPDAQGIVRGETKNLTLASLKSFIGSGSAPLTLTTTGTSGAATFDVNTNILNIPVYEGDTYNLRALQKSGASVPLKLNAASGTDSEVSFTEGTNVTLTRNSDTEITISATGGNAGVSSITNTFGTYISGTNNTAATGAVGLGTINLSASDGTSIATTRFLSKDNTWDVISASGSNNQFQYNNNGAFAGSSMLVLGTDEIVIGDTLSEQGKLRIEGSEAVSGNIKIEGTTATRGVNLSVQPAISSDYNVIFPDTGPGGNNKILESNSSGELAWVSTPVPGPITASTGTANYIPKYSSSTALANSAIYDSSSNIGIGTTNPNDGDLTIGTPKLHVAATGTSGTFNLAARFESTTTDADNTGTSILINSFNDRGLLIKAGRKDGDREVAYFDVVNSVGGTTNMLTMGKFSSVYNVGIGTATPTEKLEVAGNIKTTGGFISTVSSGYSSVELGGPSGAFIDLKGPSTDDYDLRIISGGSGGSFWTGGFGHVMTLNASGNVGIGTTSPSTRLDVSGTVNLTNLKVSGTQGTNGQALTSTGSGVGWATPPQGTITAVSGQSGISGSGTSGAVVLTNSDRGSTAVAALNFFKTIATPTNDVVASGNDDTVTLAAGGNTGIFINGQGSQVTIGLSAPTVLDRGGVKLVNATQQSTAANGLTTTAGRTYAIQLNSSGQAVVNVPWSGGSGGGISFSGTTSGGLATFSNSSTAAVSSKVTLNASGLMNFDADGNSAGSIDYDTSGTRLKIGDLSSGNSGIVEIFTNGNRQFQIGVNGEIGLGTGSTQGTSGQVLTTQGNGSPAYWTNKTVIPSNNVTGSGTTYDVPMWNIVPNPQAGIAGSYLGPNTLTGGLAASPFKGNASGQSIISTEVIGGIAFRNGSGQQATINGGTSTGPAYQINLPPSAAASTGKVLGVSGVSSNVISTSWQTAGSGGGITETIIPWNATLARTDGTSWTETNAAGQVRSDVMVIQSNNCFAIVQGNVVNYQFYIQGYFKGNTEAGGQYTSITGPLFLARCQNADGSGTVSGIPIQTSQSTTVIDNRLANGSLTVTEDPFATKQSATVFGSVPNMGTYWKLPIRGGKVGRAYTGSTTLPGFVQLFTSNAANSTDPGKEYSTCVYPNAVGDVWYSNDYEYMPEGKGYDFVFAGTITAFVAQST